MLIESVIQVQLHSLENVGDRVDIVYVFSTIQLFSLSFCTCMHLSLDYQNKWPTVRGEMSRISTNVDNTGHVFAYVRMSEKAKVRGTLSVCQWEEKETILPCRVFYCICNSHYVGKSMPPLLKICFGPDFRTDADKNWQTSLNDQC